MASRNSIVVTVRPGVGVRVLARHAGGDGGEIALCRVDADARSQAAGEAEPMRAPRADRVAQHRAEVEREPEVGVAHRADEAARQHTGHLV
jgi:hypothetical protein